MNRSSCFCVVAGVVVSALLAGGCEPTPTQSGRDRKPSRKLVFAVTPLSHPSLEQALDGFLQGLREKGFDEANTDIRLLNANGDFARIPSLVKGAIAEQPDLMFVVTTPAAAAAIKLTDPAGVPLVYTAVTDPVAAGIVTSMGKSETLATGVSDRYPVEEQVRVFKLIMPSMAKAALLFNPSEQNSQILVRLTAESLSKAAVTATKFEVRNASEIASQVKQALQSNDSVIVNGDNLVTENLSTVINLCISAKKPLFVGDPDSVKKGAVATVGPSYYDIGRLTGLKAAQILHGKSPKEIPSEYPRAYDYILNLSAARAMGIQVPPAFWHSRDLWESRASTSK